MATMGRCIPASFICETIERYPSSPNTGERFFFGGSESERTATNVIGSGFVVHLYIFKCIGCATYDEIFSQHFSVLLLRAYPFTQMHAVGVYLLDQFYVVVYDEGRTIISAQMLQA